MTGRRCRLDIYMDILRNAKTPTPSTRIIYVPNLSWKPLLDAITHLTKTGMLLEITPLEAITRPDTPNTSENIPNGRSKRLYAVSELGKATLRQYEKIRDNWNLPQGHME